MEKYQKYFPLCIAVLALAALLYVGYSQVMPLYEKRSELIVELETKRSELETAKSDLQRMEKRLAQMKNAVSESTKKYIIRLRQIWIKKVFSLLFTPI